MARGGIDPDSAYARAKLDERLASPPTPPFALTADQQTVWRMIVDTGAPQEWSGIDEFLAADLCIATIALRDSRMRLANEDPVVVGPRGGVQVNPLMPVISSLASQVLRLSARLRLGALDVGDEDNVTTATARKRKQEAELRQKMVDDDRDLILRPMPQPVQ